MFVGKNIVFLHKTLDELEVAEMYTRLIILVD